MTIKFDPNKEKSISMTVQADGVDNTKVLYTFLIEIDNVSYGFPVKNIGSRLNIEIPKLNDIVKNNIPNGEYKALIEAKIETKTLSGYYIKPWESNILIESVPKINVQLESETVDEKTIKLDIKRIIVEEEPVKPEVKEKPVKPEKKKTIFSKFMEEQK